MSKETPISAKDFLISHWPVCMESDFSKDYLTLDHVVSIMEAFSQQRHERDVKAAAFHKIDSATMPLCYESGSWDGLRSDYLVVECSDGSHHVARCYHGFMDGSEFTDWYTTDGMDVMNVTHFAEIPNTYYNQNYGKPQADDCGGK